MRGAKTKKWTDLSPAGAVPALARMRVVDVREPREFYGPLGHLEGAELAPLSALEAASGAWDPATPVLVVCRSGGRAAAACDQLLRHGFDSVFNLAGGMLDWNAGGRPVCTHSHDASAHRCGGSEV